MAPEIQQLSVGDFYEVMNDREGQLRDAGPEDWPRYFEILEGVVRAVAGEVQASVEEVFGEEAPRSAKLSLELSERIDGLQRRKKLLAQRCLELRSKHGVDLTTQSTY